MATTENRCIGLFGKMMPTDDELKKLYPEVEAFAVQMRKELWNNRHKGDQASWRTMEVRQAWGEIAWHVGKLTAAIREGDAAKVHELAADIANGALMLDDIVTLNGDHIP